MNQFAIQEAKKWGAKEIGLVDNGATIFEIPCVYSDNLIWGVHREVRGKEWTFFQDAPSAFKWAKENAEVGTVIKQS